jgi:glycosyltransferase involved in cell wall biosynthesis
VSRYRILEVLSLDRLGGTEVGGLLVFPRLNRGLFEVEVAFPGEEGPVGRELRAAGLVVHYLGGRPIRGLITLARSGRFDVVHFYGSRIGVVGRFVFALFSRRTARVLGIQHLYPYNRFMGERPLVHFLDRVERMLSRITHLYVANSIGAVERLARTGIARKKLAYLPNGLDLQQWPLEKDRYATDPPVIICIARFIPFKRHRDLLDALALLAGRGVAFRCRLVGSGPLESELRRQTAELGLSDHVEFLGQLAPENAVGRLREADVFVLTSVNEGMPRAVMEAMASGLPVAGTDANGTRDLVVHGETGYLTPVGDSHALADALERLVRDEALRTSFGRAGRARIEKEFSLDVTLQRLEDCYEAVLAPSQDQRRYD